MPSSLVAMSDGSVACATGARRRARRRTVFAADFFWLDFRRAMAAPPAQHAMRIKQNKLGITCWRPDPQRPNPQRPSPTMRLISAAVAPAARNSRKLVAKVDFDSLRPPASRMSL